MELWISTQLYKAAHVPEKGIHRSQQIRPRPARTVAGSDGSESGSDILADALLGGRRFSLRGIGEQGRGKGRGG